MEHPDDEILTQFALDDPLALDAATLVHISDCDRCTDEIQEIQRVVDAALAAGGRPDLRSLVTPPALVWDRVLVGVGMSRAGDADDQTSPSPSRSVGSGGMAAAGSGGTAAAGSGAMPPGARGMAAGSGGMAAPTASAAAEEGADEPIWLFDQPGELTTESHAGHAATVERPTDRRTLWQVAAAAVVGLVLGAGVAWVVSDNNNDNNNNDAAPTVSGDVKTSALTGYEGHQTSGEIAIVQQGGDAPQITVNLDTLDRGKGFIEAWLLNPDTGGLVALGVFDGAHGTFTVPPSLNLSKYTEVDVSREPFDGNPAHSTVSLARGPVPQL
jgi:hypothetical protein